MRPVEFDSQCYRIEGKPEFLHSGEFHYFRVPHSDWRRRMELFKEAHGNCVATYIPWLIHEPVEGEFRFNSDDGSLNLEEFLCLAQEVGLYVIAKPGPYQYSELRHGGLAPWIGDKYPQVRAKTCDGKDIGRGPVSYVHPVFLEKVRAWFARVCPIIARHTVSRGGAVALVQLDNELTGVHLWNGSPDYNPDSMGFGMADGRFTRFLERRYGGGVGALNRVWKTQYGKFEDARPIRIAPTRDSHELRRMKDYFDFYLETIAEYVTLLGRMAREHGIDTPFLHNAANPGMNPLFLETIRAMGKSFILGSDHYYHFDGYPSTRYAIKTFTSLEMLRLMGFPPTVMEMPSGAWQDWPPSAPEDHHTAYMTNLAYGLKGSNYYIFTGGQNPPNAGHTDDVYDYNAPISATNEIRPLYHVQKEFGRLMAQNPWLAEARREHDCQIAFDFDMARAEYYWKDSGAVEFAPTRALEFLRNGLLVSAFCGSLSPILCDLDNDDWIADRSTPLIVAASSCMARAKQERIVRYLRGGGKALILPTLPAMDENLKPCATLSEFLGAPRLVQGSPSPFARLVMDDVAYNCKSDGVFFTEALPSGARPVVSDTVTNGIVAWSLATEGGGEALFLGFNWSHNKHSQWQLLAKALETLGLKRKVECSDPNVWTSLLSAGGKSMLFLMNLYTSARKASVICYPHAAARPVNAGHHCLAPMEVKCLTV